MPYECRYLWRPEEGSDLLELELQVVVSCPTVLGFLARAELLTSEPSLKSKVHALKLYKGKIWVALKVKSPAPRTRQSHVFKGHWLAG